MAFNFSDLKRNQSIDKINDAVSKFKTGGNFDKDERYWRPEVDKNTGEGGAVLRFLPAPPGEEIPFVRKFSYGFKGPTGKWFIANSPSTLGLPCPVMEYNSELWNTGDEEKRDIARRQKRRLSFITNVYVVKHKARPEDEGKVFLYEFGKKIWDKLDAKMNPSDEDVQPMNPFDLWTGANFRLKVKRVASFPNYDDSTFDYPGVLSDDDALLEKIWRQAHSLSAEVAADKFENYDALKGKFYSVINPDGGTRVVTESERQVQALKDETGTDENLAPWQGKSVFENEESDELKFFSDLANGRS